MIIHQAIIVLYLISDYVDCHWAEVDTYLNNNLHKILDNKNVIHCFFYSLERFLIKKR